MFRFQAGYTGTMFLMDRKSSNKNAKIPSQAVVAYVLNSSTW